MNIQEKIKELSSKRYNFQDKMEASLNEDTLEYELDFPEIDSLAKEIQDLISKYRNDLPFEFIIEEITKLGDAPNLLYDDAGNFAISGNGLQEIDPKSGKDISSTIISFVEKEQWKPTIREALDYYLDED